MFDLRLVYEPQQSSEEVNGEIEEDEDSLEEVSPYTKEVERKNKANIFFWIRDKLQSKLSDNT